ncbi:MAG: hypothetical protein MUF42_10445 [Cytophagaceae bacterium]|jgi:hypothetical protein|nr:hypothetical protein [Cytophagaceae bacterium]
MKSKQATFRLLALLILLSLLACTKLKKVKEENETSIVPATAKVVIAGSRYALQSNNIVNNVSTLWEGSQFTSYPTMSNFTDLEIVGSDRYACGFKRLSFNNSNTFTAIYWKNGISVTLPSSSADYSVANAIWLDQGDVYICGEERNSQGKLVAVYWKNGVKTTLSNGAVNALAKAIYVDNQEVYVAGEEDNHAVYWKGAQRYQLDFGNYKSSLNNLLKQDASTVLTVGYKDTINSVRLPVRWNNFTRKELTALTYSGEAYQVLNKKSDTYIFGYATNPSTSLEQACYWKNDSLVYMGNSATSSYCYNACFDGEDLYACGEALHSSGVYSAAYWKNKEATVFLSPGIVGESQAIAIAK